MARVPTLDLELLGSWLLHLRAERTSPQTLKPYGDGVRRYEQSDRDRARAGGGLLRQLGHMFHDPAERLRAEDDRTQFRERGMRIGNPSRFVAVLAHAPAPFTHHPPVHRASTTSAGAEWAEHVGPGNRSEPEPPTLAAAQGRQPQYVAAIHIAAVRRSPGAGADRALDREVGDAYDNALMESIIVLYKTECIRPGPFHAEPLRTIADDEYATMAWLYWWNNRRLHSTLGIPTPDEYEQANFPALNPEPHPHESGREPVTVQVSRGFTEVEGASRPGRQIQSQGYELTPVGISSP